MTYTHAHRSWVLVQSQVNMGEKQTSVFRKCRGDKRGPDKRKSTTTAAETTAKKKVSFNRKDESHLKYGRIAPGNSHAPSPLCAICSVRLCNEALKP